MSYRRPSQVVEFVTRLQSIHLTVSWCPAESSRPRFLSRVGELLWTLIATLILLLRLSLYWDFFPLVLAEVTWPNSLERGAEMRLNVSCCKSIISYQFLANIKDVYSYVRFFSCKIIWTAHWVIFSDWFFILLNRIKDFCYRSLFDWDVYLS